jgi:hypothetical protein
MWPRLPGPRRDGYVIRAGPVRLDRGLTVVSTSVPSTVEAICIKKNDVQWDSSCRGSPPAPRMHCVYQHRAQQRKVRVAVKIRSCAKGHLPSCRPQPTDLALRLYYGVSVLFAYLRHGACRMPGVPPGRHNSSTAIQRVICSKSCCIGLDGNDNETQVDSCRPSSSTSSPTSAIPARSTGPGDTPTARPTVASSTVASPEGGSTASGCFPAHSTVELESGLRLRMDELRVGDRVRVAKDAFSDVFLFTHKIQSATAAFVFIQTTSEHSISMTPGHYVYANGTSLVPAASVRVGDELTLASGARSTVVSISAVVHAGVYNPQTLHGDIVVDEIVASTYTTAVSPVLGHASLSPLRALYSALGVTTGLLNDGADHAVHLLPSGVHSY